MLLQYMLLFIIISKGLGTGGDFEDLVFYLVEVTEWQDYEMATLGVFACYSID